MDWSFTIGTLSFGILDIITVVIVLVGAISGCITGFSVSATRLVGLLLAIPVSLLFTKDLAAFVESRTEIPLFWSTLIVFVALSLVVYLLICILGSQLSTILGASSHLRAIDSILGFIWGLLASSITLSIILAVLNFQSFVDISVLTDKSIIINEIIKPLFPTLKDSFMGAFDGV